MPGRRGADTRSGALRCAPVRTASPPETKFASDSADANLPETDEAVQPTHLVGGIRPRGLGGLTTYFSNLTTWRAPLPSSL